MMLTPRSMRANFRRGLLALLICAVAAPAFGDEPTPGNIALAAKLLDDVGLRATVESAVPNLLGEFEHNMLTTHPEMKAPLHETLVALMPDLVKSSGNVLNDASRVLAAGMTEADLKASLAFFDSASGKKYLAAQGPILQQLQASGMAWRQQMSNQLLPRVREDMKKKGYEF